MVLVIAGNFLHRQRNAGEFFIVRDFQRTCITQSTGLVTFEPKRYAVDSVSVPLKFLLMKSAEGFGGLRQIFTGTFHRNRVEKFNIALQLAAGQVYCGCIRSGEFSEFNKRIRRTEPAQFIIGQHALPIFVSGCIEVVIMKFTVRHNFAVNVDGKPFAVNKGVCRKTQHPFLTGFGIDHDLFDIINLPVQFFLIDGTMIFAGSFYNE